MFRFGIATGLPVLSLFMASAFGGVWSLFALLSITFLAVLLDRLTEGLVDDGAEFPTAKAISITLGIFHFPLLFCAIAMIGNTEQFSVAERLTTMIAFALYFGQISNSNAHELIHSRDRLLRRLGDLVYTSVLFGHHSSAHRLVHHVHVGTDADPNSARLGEGFYAYAIRASVSEYLSGLSAENKLRARGRRKTLHPYIAYALGGAAMIGAGYFLSGVYGIGVLIMIGFMSHLQMLLSDYVQHYGLRRNMRADGSVEPVGPQHSWNAPQWYTSAMMMNAPRHSDHHAKPLKPYNTLELDPQTMPMLPHSLPVMAVVALIPSLWRYIMDPKVEHLLAYRNYAGEFFITA